MSTRRAFYSVPLIVLPALTLAAQVDDLHSRMLKDFQVPIRWDNVEKLPSWCLDQEVRTEKHASLRIFVLKPGRSLYVSLRASSYLRVKAFGATSGLQDLEVGVTDGSGLVGETLPLRVAKTEERVFGPNLDHPVLVRIHRPEKATGVMKLALFRTRQEFVPDLPPYRFEVPLDSVRHKLGTLGTWGTLPFWELNPGKLHPIRVAGPARLAVRFKVRLDAPLPDSTIPVHLAWTLDGAPARNELVESSTGNETPVFVDGKSAPLGRDEICYFDIPAGVHTLALGSDVPLLVRPLRQRKSDYLFTGNEVKPRVETLQKELTQYPAIKGSEVLARAQSTAQDNRYRDAGTAGVGALESFALGKIDDEGLQGTLQHFRDAHTYFLNLVPQALSATPLGEPSLKNQYLHAPQIEDEWNPERLRSASQAGREALLDQLPQGLFHPLAGGKPKGLVYDLPERSAPARLRLLVDGSSRGLQARFWVQCDAQAPRLFVLGERVQIPPTSLDPTIAELGLALTGERFGYEAQPTLAFGATLYRPAFPLVDGGSLDFPLPQNVKQIHIWREDEGARPIWLSLQLQASQPYLPTETSFSSALDGKVPNASTLLRTALDTELPLELRPWLPLIRWVQAQDRTLREGVGLDPAALARLNAPEGSGAASIMAQALKDEASGQWARAIETWIKAYASGTRKERITIHAALISDLMKMGEPDLAVQRLRLALLGAEDAALRISAQLKLEEIYRDTKDVAALEALLGASVLRDPAALEKLARFQVEQGQSKMALLTMLLIPGEQRPKELLAQVLYQERWIRSLHRLLDGMGNVPDRWIWEGVLALNDGEWDIADAFFSRAGEHGVAWTTAHREARRIAADLRSPDSRIREGAQRDWETWNQHRPGAMGWRQEPQLVVDAAGGCLLRAVQFETQDQAFLTSLKRPVRLKFVGPLKLRLEVHPLHAQNGKEPLEGWLEVRSGEGKWVQPFLDNFPNPALEVAGHSELLPGMAIYREMDLGPGLQEIEVSTGAQASALMVLAYRSVLPAGPLPERTLETMAAPFRAPLDPPLKARSWKPGRPGAIFLQEDRNPNYKVLDAETLRTQWRRSEAKPEMLVGSPSAALPPSAVALNKGDAKGLLGSPCVDSVEAFQDRINALAYLAEREPAFQPAALAEAERMASLKPQRLELAIALERLRRQTIWTPVTSVLSSAGLSTIPLTDWAPEVPSLMVRRSLEAVTGAREILLGGPDVLTFTLQSLKPVTLRGKLSMAEPGALPPQPVSVLLNLDGKTARFTLNPESPAIEVKQRMLAGRHGLQIRLDQPLKGQFVKLQFLEGLGAGEMEQPDRSYQVATAREPVRVHVEGPAWLRCDCLHNGRTDVSFQSIAAGGRDLEFRPPAGEAEAFFRIFTEEIEPGRPVPEGRPTKRTVIPVLPQPVPVADPPYAAPVHLQDAYSLGGQEDGSWLFTSRAVNRRDAENSEKTAQAERFAEFKLSHSYWDDLTRSYREFGVLGRVHEYGQAPGIEVSKNQYYGVGGLEGHWERSPWNSPLLFQVDGNLFAQSAKAGHSALGGMISADVAAPTELGPRTIQIPQFGILGRFMAANLTSINHRYELDQDIWTPFKEHHLKELTLSETLSHSPWLDTQWNIKFEVQGWVRARPVDEGSASMEWRQRLGCFEATVGGEAAWFRTTPKANEFYTRTSFDAGLEWHHWFAHQDGLRLRLDSRYDREFREWSGAFGLSWIFGNGRGLKDASPGWPTFRNIEYRELSKKSNNRIVDASHE